MLDDAARPVGVVTKGVAHTSPGVPHLAFSLLLMDPAGERMLLQRRASGAQHFAGAWSNTCCSHPRPGETPIAAAHRRVVEELGIEGSDLRVAGSFWYHAEDPVSGRVEREHDVVIVGVADADPRPDPDQVDAVRWWPVGQRNAVEQLGPITPWFRDVLRVAFDDPAIPVSPSAP